LTLLEAQQAVLYDPVIEVDDLALEDEYDDELSDQFRVF
jgi:hypothetical protein